MPVEPWVLLIYALAVARITGLIVADVIFDGPRSALLGRLDPRPATLGAFVAGLLTCPWCVSIWVAAAASPAVWWFGDRPWLLIPAIGLAFSQVVGMTSEIGR